MKYGSQVIELGKGKNAVQVEDYSGPLSQDSNAVSLSRTFDFTRSGTALPRFCF